MLPFTIEDKDGVTVNGNTLFATFYSFKGGVGRTLALVNTAVWLAHKGHSVIIWDMDVEAPGVQNIPYFKPMEQEAGGIKGGFVDVVADFKGNKCRCLDSRKFSDYLVKHPENPRLSLLPAGRLDDEGDYSSKFSSIEWEKLFGEKRKAGFLLFELIRKELLRHKPDFVLIDSRTGYTDIGGVCCVQLPDVVFLVFNYGSQNLRGTRIVHSSLTDRDAMKVARTGRELKVYRVASMAPSDRPDLREERLKEWNAFNLRPHVEVSYNPQVAFDETVWMAKYPDHVFCSGYREIAKILTEERLSIPVPAEATGKGSSPPNPRIPGYSMESGFESLDKHKNFERMAAELFKLMGYEVELGRQVGGGWIDMFLTMKTQIDERCFIVECKESERYVDRDVVEQVKNALESVRKELPSCLSIIVARRGFTKDAQGYAALHNITVKAYDELLNGLVNFDRYIAYLRTFYAGTELERNYIEQNVIVEDTDHRAQPLLDYIKAWLEGSSGGFFTLLGDFGTGKTSFTRRLAHDMALEYERNRAATPAPVLINLKDARKALSLETILFDHFSKTAQMSVSPESILFLLREGKILLVFDGFDEMATQTSAALTMQNFQELCRAFSGNAKIILTCRTHYFKDRTETEETLQAERQGLPESSTELYKAIKGREGYAIGYVQEFTESQVVEYLRKAVPETWEEAWATIDGVYNLKDLSSRPVLLDMIVKSLPRIQGGVNRILAADLYGAYVQTWLERDDWRLELTRDGRELLVEEIAERLWEEDSERLHFSFLGDVLKDYLKEKNRTVTLTDVELASSEVRTASFLTRNEEGNYGFAHRSFMEYFLAKRIARRLKGGDVQCLDVRQLSKEIILFLGQMTDAELLVKTTGEILSQSYRKRISENALHIFYWCVRYLHSSCGNIKDSEALKVLFEELRPTRVLLEGAVLDRAELAYVDLTGAKMDKAGLKDSILTGARLSRASLREADLSEANLDGADCSGGDLSNVTGRHARFRKAILRNANLSGANLEACNLLNADMHGVDLTGANLFRAGLLRAGVDERWLTGTRPQVVGMPGTKLYDLLPRTHSGHSRGVNSVAFSIGGRKIASGSWDQTIRLWDIENGEEIACLEGHFGAVSSVVFSPDGKMIASGGWDQTIRLWDTKNCKEINFFESHSGGILSVCFSPDGEKIASGSSDCAIQLWDVGSGKEIASMKGHLGDVNSVCFSPDGKRIASGGSDCAIQVWDVESCRRIVSITGHSDVVGSVAFSPDGKRIASGSWDQTVRLWDVGSGEELASLKGHFGVVYSVAFSPDGKKIVSGSWDQTVRLWDTEVGQQVAYSEGHTGVVYSVAFSPDGEKIAAGSSNGTIRILDAESGKRIGSLEGYTHAARSVAFSPDGNTIAVGSDDNAIRLWEAENCREAAIWEGHSDVVGSVAFSPDGKRIASGSWDQTVRLWDVGSGEELASLKGHFGVVYSVAFSPDGKKIVSGSWDQTVRLWDTEVGQQVAYSEGHTGVVYSVAFSPDGEKIAAGSSNGTIRILDAESGKRIGSLEGYTHAARSVAFSPDGNTIAVGSDDNAIRLWEAENCREAAIWEGHSDVVGSVAFSPDGKRIASGSWDQTVRLWDVEGGEEVAALKGHCGVVRSVAFTPDGERIAGISWDNTIRLWDIKSGMELASLKDCPGTALSISFNPHGTMLAVGSSEGVSLLLLSTRHDKTASLTRLVTFYHLPNGEWAAIDFRNRFACSAGGRDYLAFKDNLAIYPASDLPELEQPEGLFLEEIKRFTVASLQASDEAGQGR